MRQTATQNATGLAQIATRHSSPAGRSTVAVWIGDARARERALTALHEEGVRARLVTARDFSMHGLEGPPAAALLYDLAPWNDDALKFLRRLREQPVATANLPILIYAPPRPEIGRLLVEAGRLPMVCGELQFGEGSDIARLRRTIRKLQAVTPAAVVLQLLMVYAPELPPLVIRFCEIACTRLAAGHGDRLTVSLIASDLGADRRTLERRWRNWNLPAPKELLNWIIILLAAYLAERHHVSIYETNELLGMSPERLRRCRFRIRPLPLVEKGLDPILVALATRISRFVP